MDKFGKLGRDGKISPRDLEKMLEEGFDDDDIDMESEKVSIDAINTDRIHEQAKQAKKQALHELPSDYQPPILSQEVAPTVVDKRVVYAVVGLCVLIVAGALAFNFFRSSSSGDGTPCDLQLIMGRNVKRNMDGGVWATLSIPADLAVNDLIKTGSDRRNIIALPDGSTLRLDYNSTIKISSAKKVKDDSAELHITLHKGAIFVDECGSSNISVETKYAKFTPVGTRFGVTQIERKDLTEQSMVNVVEGSVRMSHIEDPDSSIIVTAGQQASATAQSLIKPKKSEKDDWMSWNGKWRDIRSIPSLGKAKLRKGDRNISTDNNDKPQPQPAEQSAPTSNQTNSSYHNTPNRDNHDYQDNHRNEAPDNYDNIPTEHGGKSSMHNGELPPQDSQIQHRESREEREAREAREREINAHREAERRQAEENKRQKPERKNSDYTGSAKDQYNKYFHDMGSIDQRAKAAKDRRESERAREAATQRSEELIAPRDEMPDLQTGIINSYNEPSHQENNGGYRNNGPVRGPHYDGPNPNAAPRQGLMAPIGNSNSMNATIGDSSSMDAKIGESSSMDAKIGTSW